MDVLAIQGKRIFTNTSKSCLSNLQLEFNRSLASTPASTSASTSSASTSASTSALYSTAAAAVGYTGGGGSSVYSDTICHHCDTAICRTLFMMRQTDDAADTADADDEGNELNRSSLIPVTQRRVDSSAVNLDITAMIALVSNVSHGDCHCAFSDDHLTSQAKDEREDPILPKLFLILQNKKIIVCETALNDFHTILIANGGPVEKQRARTLLSVVRCVDDNPSARSLALKNTARIKEHTKIIFGTGDSHGAVTLSANKGFVRASKQFGGVDFHVHLHSARSLTEKKKVKSI